MHICVKVPCSRVQRLPEDHLSVFVTREVSDSSLIAIPLLIKQSCLTSSRWQQGWKERSTNHAHFSWTPSIRTLSGRTGTHTHTREKDRWIRMCWCRIDFFCAGRSYISFQNLTCLKHHSWKWGRAIAYYLVIFFSIKLQVFCASPCILNLWILNLWNTI